MRFFYALLFLFIGIWFYLFKPYEVTSSSKEGGELVLERFTYTESMEAGIAIRFFGERGRYGDRRFYVHSPVLVDNRKGERIEAKEGYYEEKILNLNGDVRYRSQQYSLESQRAIYDSDKKTLYVPTRFLLTSKEGNSSGESLVYYKSSGKIVAYDIDAKVRIR